MRTRDTLSRHYVQHERGKFTCDICNRSYHSYQYLKTHMDVHKQAAIARDADAHSASIHVNRSDWLDSSKSCKALGLAEPWPSLLNEEDVDITDSDMMQHFHFQKKKNYIVARSKCNLFRTRHEWYSFQHFYSN